MSAWREKDGEGGGDSRERKNCPSCSLEGQTQKQVDISPRVGIMKGGSTSAKRGLRTLLHEGGNIRSLRHTKKLPPGAAGCKEENNPRKQPKEESRQNGEHVGHPLGGDHDRLKR